MVWSRLLSITPTISKHNTHLATSFRNKCSAFKFTDIPIQYRPHLPPKCIYKALSNCFHPTSPHTQSLLPRPSSFSLRVYLHRSVSWCHIVLAKVPQTSLMPFPRPFRENLCFHSRPIIIRKAKAKSLWEYRYGLEDSKRRKNKAGEGVRTKRDRDRQRLGEERGWERGLQRAKAGVGIQPVKEKWGNA